MGWRYRKSAKAGPFRLNFSKSGIGYSVGSKHYRVTKTAKGTVRETVTPHQIRHGYATALLESGVDPKTAQVLLGHAQLSTTMDIYTHVRDGQLKAAAEKMEAGF